MYVLADFWYDFFCGVTCSAAATGFHSTAPRGVAFDATVPEVALDMSEFLDKFVRCPFSDSAFPWRCRTCSLSSRSSSSLLWRRGYTPRIPSCRTFGGRCPHCEHKITVVAQRQFPVVLQTIEIPLLLDTVIDVLVVQLVQIFHVVVQLPIPMSRLFVGPKRFPSSASTR